MKNFISNQWPIVVAFCLPFLVLIVFAVSMYFPVTQISTKYDFVYATCTPLNSYDSCYSFMQNRNWKASSSPMVVTVDPIQPNTPVTSPLKPKNSPGEFEVKFYKHDTETNNSVEMSETEMRNYSYLASRFSPDDIELVSDWQNRGGDFFFLSSQSEYVVELRKGSAGKTQNVAPAATKGYDSFYFIGWILN